MISNVNIIEGFQEDMRGVFTLSDLKGILPCRHANTFYRAVTNLEENKIIFRFARGIYVTERFELPVVSQKICPASYISLEYVLARSMIIGTVPRREIKAIKIGKRREYRSDMGTVLHLGVAKHLYFGFETKEGVNLADKEKAFLDTLYFYCKGQRFYFDIYSDMNMRPLDMKKVKKYLTRYKNPRFIKFVEAYVSSIS